VDRISDLPTLAARLGPVVYAPDRLAALNAGGVDLGPAIPADVRAALIADPLGSAGRIAGAAEVGPTVPISITTHERPHPGPRPRPREAARSRTASGFDIVATVFLSSVEDIVAKLWDALVYPQDLAPGDVARLFDAAALSSFFTGVPDGAEVGPMLFPVPPTLRVDASDVVALEQPFRAQLIAPAGPVELIATATVRIPLQLIVPDDGLRLNPATIASGATVSVAMDTASGPQPRDASSLAGFAAHIQPNVAAGIALGLKPLKLSPVFGVPGPFDRSQLRIVAAAVWLTPAGAEPGMVTIGVVVQAGPGPVVTREIPAADQLAPYNRLSPPDTIWITVSESLVQQALQAITDSGELADRLTAKLDWLDFFSIPHRIEVDSVDVRFDDGAINVDLECRDLDVCAFGVDLGFRASVALRPEIAGSDLRLNSDGIDIDFDNLDTIYCALTSILTGPLGLIALTVGTFIASVITVSFNRKTPGFWQGQRLPDSDVFPRIDLRYVGPPSTGISNALGAWYLAPDEISTFVVAQVLQLQEATGEVTVVAGVTVNLGPTDDHQVATAVTERHGLALITTVLDDVGGELDIARTRYGPGGPGFTTHSIEGAHGDNPDLALTVTLKDGFQPVRRRPIAFNLGEHRLGTIQDPVRIVYVDRCVGERHAVSDAAATVAEIEGRLAELKAEYESLPPSEQGPVGKMIRKIQDQELAPATARLATARAALQTCQQAV
jgi:hypothetical protein